jgi:mannose-6-phosphate isomerase class I
MSYNKYPAVKIPDAEKCFVGWEAILGEVIATANNLKTNLITIECYHGVYENDLKKAIHSHDPKATVISAREVYKSEEEIIELTYPDTTDDRIFGRITNLQMEDFLSMDKIESIRNKIKDSDQLIFVIGAGAAVITEPYYTIAIYADMARWEIQQRMRRKEVPSLGLSNATDSFEQLYKRGYFLDWRVCDTLKRNSIDRWNYWLDTNKKDNPKMITGHTLNVAMDTTIAQPFSVVPFFDPGPWGGQWMRKQFNLENNAPNYAWGFNCVPEENSLLLDFDGVIFEIPSINIVFFRPDELLGVSVRERFGEEFPIRFDFLDTIEGGNLSLQVHPSDEYISREFNMSYTQDESYYMLDTTENARVYLGLKTDVDSDAMINDLKSAQTNGQEFNADVFTESWTAKKHDHFLIPAGTVHCSGEGCMILEISATPYIFTFKLYDWGRVGLDGKPRAINIDRGSKVIQWNRQTEYVKQNLINCVETIAEGKDWREERTGLHPLQFIETRRHWQSGTVLHETGGTVNVLMVVDGKQAIVESPDNEFQPFPVNFGEAFIIPAKIKKYSIRPYGKSEGEEIATLKAYVRDNH